jgi:hypothetical protein
MKYQFWLFLVIVCLIFYGLWLLYRLYKRIGRRCDCGEMFRNRARSEIRLSCGFFNHWYAWKMIKERRWWVRGAQTVTYSDCPTCNLKKVVTISNRPISLWHLCWVWFIKDRRQFYSDPSLSFVLEKYLLDARRKKDLPTEETDVPFRVTLTLP